MSKQRCVAMRNDGEQCTVDFGINPDNGRCWHHDPDREQERADAKRRGGSTTASLNNKRQTKVVAPRDAMHAPSNVADAVRWASWLPRAIATGEIDKATGREINKALRTFVALHEMAHVEAEVAALRRDVEMLKRGL